MTERRIFTPRPVAGTDPGPFPVWEDGWRREMYVSGADRRAFDDAKWSNAWVPMTDLDTGLTVLARQADCGAGCRCAAEYVWDPEMIPAESLGGAS